MIKVLHFIHGLNTGGAETLVKEYALGLDKHIFDVTVICLGRHPESPYEEELESHGIKVIFICDYVKNFYGQSIPDKVIKHYRAHRIIRKIIQEIRPDIIHYHLNLSIYLLTAGIPDSCSLFLTVHNEPEVLWDHHLGRRIDFHTVQYFVSHRGMTLIALHEKMRQQLMDMFHTQNVLQLNNGINFEKYETLQESKTAIRKSLRIPPNDFVIGHVGRFSYQKNHEFLIDVFHEVVGRNPHAFLLMVGAGEERPKIEEKIHSYGLDERILILDNRNDIPRMMRAMDVFVFPSKFEGLPIVMIEAQKSGLPCVISDTISKAVEVTNLVHRLPLSAGAQKWADAIESAVKEKGPVVSEGLEDWDIRKACRKLESFYLTSLKK